RPYDEVVSTPTRRFHPGPHQRGAWYWVITVLSFGLLAAVPFIHAAWAVRTRKLQRMAVGLGVVNFVVLMIYSLDEEVSSAGLSAIASLSHLALAVAAVVMLNPVRRKVYRLDEAGYGGYQPYHPAVSAQQQAVAAVEYGRHLRQEARKILHRDPMMARELRIGRPDLPRTYDDGGLVDLNTAPGEGVATRGAIRPGLRV